MPFAASISHVICVGAQEEMIRSDTGGIVTVVKNVETIWNRTEVKFPGKAMSFSHHSIYREFTVPVSSFCTSPEPASIGLLNLRPEAFERVGSDGKSGKMKLHLKVLLSGAALSVAPTTRELSLSISRIGRS